MAKKTEKLVHCRYAQCAKLHETTELKKEDAVQGGRNNNYYHQDCYHTMVTIMKIRDIFIKNINPMMTGQQIGTLVSTVNNMVFSKKIDVDYILFALEYFVKHKPGKLKYPYGMYYIVQDRDVSAAWNKEQDRILRAKIAEEFKNAVNNDNYAENEFVYKPPRPKSFADILG